MSELTFSIEENENVATDKLTDTHISFEIESMIRIARITVYIKSSLMLIYSEPKALAGREFALGMSLVKNLKGVNQSACSFIDGEYSTLNFEVNIGEAKLKCQEIFDFLKTKFGY